MIFLVSSNATYDSVIEQVAWNCVLEFWTSSEMEISEDLRRSAIGHGLDVVGGP